MEKIKMRIIIYLFFLTSLLMPVLKADPVRVAWVSRVPYSYQTNNYDVAQLKGLDIDFMRDLCRRLGKSVLFVQVNEKDIQQIIDNKSVDIILGMPENSFPDLEWTSSYRSETYVVYLQPNSKEFFYSVDDLLKLINKDNPLGLTTVRSITNETINQFINSPENQDKYYLLNSEADLLEGFLEGNLKTFIGDRIVFSTLLHRLHQWKYVREINLDLQKPIALGVLKSSPMSEQLSTINDQIETMKKNGRLDRLFTEYLTPAILMHTIDEGWLRFIELMGVVAFAIYAFIHGFYRHMAFIKTVGFSMIVVFTGPVLKDVLTTGKIEFFRNPYYISIVIGIVLVAHAIISTLRTLSYRQIRTYIFSENKDRWLQEIASAVGLASYTISGVLYAITSADTSWFWEGMLGTITATSGLFLAHELYKLPSRINFLFSEISFGWGTLLALYFTLSRSAVDFDQEGIFLAVMVVWFGIFLSRMMALYHEVSSIGFGRKVRETINNL